MEGNRYTITIGISLNLFLEKGNKGWKMERFKNNNINHLFNLIAAIVSGVLLALAYSLEPIVWAAWIAPVPILIVAYKVKPVHGLLYGAIVGIIASSSSFTYIMDQSAFSTATLFALTRGIQWAIMIWLASIASKRVPPTLEIFAFPSVFASFDYLAQLFSPFGSAYSIAYSQMDFLPMIQLASIGGTVAITFILALAASVISYVIYNKRKGLIGLVLAILLLVGSLLYGELRMNQETEKKSIRISLLNIEKNSEVLKGWEESWKVYREKILELEGQNIDLFLLPEKAIQIEDKESQKFLEDIKKVASYNDSAILIGVDEKVEDKKFNRGYFILPTDEVYPYDKMHRDIQAESNVEIGEKILTLDYKKNKIGIAMGSDLDFPQRIMEYADTDLLLVPAGDVEKDSWYHSRVAMLRGIENGMSIARNSQGGYLTLSDDKGQILSEKVKADKDTEIKSLIMEMEIGNRKTIYENAGTPIGWGMIIYTVICIVLIVLRKPKVTEIEE